MKRVLLSVPVLLLLPALATAQNPAVSPESSEIARAKVAAKAHRATRVLGEAVGLDNRPVTPATAATRATRATPATHDLDGGRATPATPATPAVPASPSRRPDHAGQGGQGHGNNPRRP